ncbi:hypothetical protein D3C71_1302240 [compost metagenome]
MRFQFDPWLIKKSKTNKSFNSGKPIPLLVMFGEIIKENDKSFLINVHGKPEPSSICFSCGAELTHPVSVLYGIGPDCGKHFHISPVKDIMNHMDELKKKFSDIKWRGLVPKKSVVITPEYKHIIVFRYNGIPTRVETTDESKVQLIYNNSEVLSHEKIEY